MMFVLACVFLKHFKIIFTKNKHVFPVYWIHLLQRCNLFFGHKSKTKYLSHSPQKVNVIKWRHNVQYLSILNNTSVVKFNRISPIRAISCSQRKAILMFNNIIKYLKRLDRVIKIQITLILKNTLQSFFFSSFC